ncbi:MAG: ubiquinol-cytochrome c reductase iron-sulfur subunit [Gomphosphaeria aponina SAG 52.96 = DSM 107014]|uniref:Ubiquinol-cytochrome c reductase iron-sulfur subunit n=1 Tax=Gomphosphaeria aponina SAG 52.96 = DSM 107014 TaxID=1521640 RepID=A0A941GPH5_9CHRO|nr:ubiquinol-cytochrome c reductase iron-sulfur subunit [Gomphosphaeria aponina SAG 52.96 = DSM 107014]
MERRQFLFWLSCGWLSTWLPAIFSHKAVAQDEFVSVGTLTQLKENGQILNEESPTGAVLVIPSPDDPDSLIAVNPTCTHEGCIVEWDSEQEYFLCPCHSSKFKVNGEVMEGRATLPLDTYTVKVEGDEVLVQPVI